MSASRTRQEADPTKRRKDPTVAETSRALEKWRGGHFPGASLWAALSSMPAEHKSPPGKQTRHVAAVRPASGSCLGKQTRPN